MAATMTPADPRKRFSATVDDYDAYRPSYPAAMVDWVLNTAGVPAAGTIADVGCGTGISTRLFAARGLDVVGVEPNDEMRARAVARGNARYMKGDAAATGLPARSMDLVVAAQAFHWFDIEPTLAEFERVLKPGGWCAAFWNDRTDETPFMRAYEDLLLEFSSEYRVVNKKHDALSAIKASPRVVRWTEMDAPNAQAMDRCEFRGRVHSSSYVAHGVSRPAELDKALDALFDRSASSGKVEFLYRTVGACWQLRSPDLNAQSCTA